MKRLAAVGPQRRQAEVIEKEGTAQRGQVDQEGQGRQRRAPPPGNPVGLRWCGHCGPA